MNGSPLSYVVRKRLVTTSKVEYPSNRCDTINEEMIERDPIVVAVIFGTNAALEENVKFTASYLTDRATVWAKMNYIFVDSRAWTYCKVDKRQRNCRKGYLALRGQYLRPNNVDHMESAAKKILQNKVYHGGKNKNTFESYVTIQKEQHTIL